MNYLEKPTVSAIFVQQLLSQLTPSKTSIDSLVLSLEVRGKLSSGKSFTSAEVCQLITAIQLSLDDELMGLLPKKVPLDSFSVALDALRYLPNMNSAIQWLNSYYSLYAEKPIFRFERSSNTYYLYVNEQPNKNSSLALYVELSLICIYKTLCLICKTNIPLVEVGLSFPVDIVKSEMHYLFSVEKLITTKSPYISFDKSMLNLPVYVIDIPGQDMLYHSIITWLRRKDVLTKIINMAENTTPLSFPNKKTVASNLNISQQTLTRRLTAEGFTYQDIKDLVRKERAISLLINPHVTIKKIALELGFSEPHGFTKAFRKWFSMSPSEYRKKILEK